MKIETSNIGNRGKETKTATIFHKSMSAFEVWQAEQRKVALKSYRRVVAEIRESNGSVHATTPEVAIDHGLYAGLSPKQIKRDLCDAGCKSQNIEGSLRVTLARA